MLPTSFDQSTDVTDVTQFRRVPPSREQILAAVARLLPNRPQLTAFHLATPIDVAATVEVGRAGALWSWRGSSSAHRDPTAAAAALAALNWRDSDEFLDLAASPFAWLKPVRSGSGTVVFGMDVLFGAPPVVGHRDVNPDDLLSVATAVAGGSAAGERLTRSGMLVVVRHAGGFVQVVPADTQRR